jgi:glutamate racemase
LRAVYVADQTHVPYGERGLDEVATFARAISGFLAGVPCGAIVMACNISSATALGDVAAAFPTIPVFGVISAGVKAAIAEAQTADGGTAIGVLATPGTVRTGAYPAAIASEGLDVEVHSVPCPDLVPMIETGEDETPRMLGRCMEYLEPLAAARCGVVILGCTHYPLALSTLRVAAMRLYDVPPVFIDPARAVAAEVCVRLEPAEGPETEGEAIRLLTSGDVGAFRRQLRRFAPTIPAVFGAVRWSPEGSLSEVEQRPPGRDHARRNVRSASSGLHRSLSGQPDVPSPRET